MTLIFAGQNAGLLLTGPAAHDRRRRRLKALALGIEPLERWLADRGVRQGGVIDLQQWKAGR